MPSVDDPEQWSAYGLETIARLNEAVCESGQPLVGNYCYFHLQPVSRGLPPDPLRRLKRDVLRQAAAHPRTGLEIGFNAGHSAVVMLDANPRLHLTIIDGGAHRYTRPCAAIVAERYPGRLRMLWGPSRAVTAHLVRARDTDFQFIHIDGSHSVRDATADIVFALRHGGPGCVVVVDDLGESHIESILRWALAGGYFEVPPGAAPPGDNRVLLRTRRPVRLGGWLRLLLTTNIPRKMVRERIGNLLVAMAGGAAR